ETVYTEQVVPDVADVSISLNKDKNLNPYSGPGFDYEVIGDAYTISFNDAVEEEQFYIVQAYGKYQIDSNFTISGQRLVLHTSNPTIGGGGYALLLSDKVSTFTNSLQLEQWFQVGENKPISVDFEFQAVSKSYVDYYRSMNDYLAGDGNPFAEPVVLYTNVDNGLGVFSIKNAKRFEVIR
ncbi:MAG: DUF4249 family protein, partial [Saprospiraceae bacterium]